MIMLMVDQSSQADGISPNALNNSYADESGEKFGNKITPIHLHALSLVSYSL